MFSFSGRATRKEYWTLWLFSTLALFLGIIIAAMIQMGTNSSAVNIIFAFVEITYIIFSVSILTRRLHDIGKSGWWQLVSIIPFGIFVLLYWTIKDSDPFENQYGENPKLQKVSDENDDEKKEIE